MGYHLMYKAICQMSALFSNFATLKLNVFAALWVYFIRAQEIMQNHFRCRNYKIQLQLFLEKLHLQQLILLFFIINGIYLLWKVRTD